MSNHESEENHFSSDDKRELFRLHREDRERIASVEGSVEALANSVRTGFENLGSRLDDLSTAQRAARPQLGVIVTTVIAGAAFLVSLATLALKSTAEPLAHDIIANEKLSALRHEEDRTLKNEMFTVVNGRIADIERRLQVRMSDHDDAQDVKIEHIYTVIDDLNRLLLKRYISEAANGHATP